MCAKMWYLVRHGGRHGYVAINSMYTWDMVPPQVIGHFIDLVNACTLEETDGVPSRAQKNININIFT